MNYFLEFNQQMMEQHPFFYGASFGFVAGFVIIRRSGIPFLVALFPLLKLSAYSGLCFVVWRHSLLVIDQLELLQWRPLKLPLLVDFISAKIKR